MEKQVPTATARPKSKKTPILPRIFIATLAGVFIFSLGFNAGRQNFSFQQVSRQNTGLPEDLDYATVESVYDKLRTQYDGKLDEQQLLDGLKKGLAGATGDPHTEYFNAEAATEFNQELSGTFSGIGAELGTDENGTIQVISPIADFPAAKAGILPKDLIVRINDESTAGMTISQAVSKIRGEVNTKVKLSLIRGTEQIEVEITRAQIKVPSVKYEILADNIGYLQISRYGDDTTELATQAATEFAAKNVRGVILDLRQDPGGLLDAAVEVSSLWLPKGQTVLTEKRDDVTIKTFASSGPGVLAGKKTIVLIDEGSASASEITAGALRDNKAATTMGVKSYGKGSVQQLVELGGSSLLKVTIAHWFTPSGQGIDKKGIEPDVKVERTVDDIKAGRDPQKDAAIQALKQ